MSEARVFDPSHLREESVENTLASQERIIRGQLLSHRPWCPNGPQLHHRVLRDLTLEFCLEHSIIYGIAALLNDIRNCTKGPGGQHDLVVVDEGVLVDPSEYVTA